jgi:SNF2 family DNA or RNA helicase
MGLTPLPQGGWRPSTKVSALVSELTALGAKGQEAEERADWQLLPGKRPKSVVFSQWTAMLDLLEVPAMRTATHRECIHRRMRKGTLFVHRHTPKQVALGKEGIPSVRLDGSLSMQQRTSILSDFSASSAQGVLLMSLKAGGQGLNLCFCQNVFLVDPWWNPHMEEQAIARVHRIGQMHDVTVKRLIVRDTVEERIIEMQDRKMSLSEGALGGAGLGEKKTADERIKELQRLFEDDADTRTTQSNGILAAAAAPQESGCVQIGVP